MEHFHCYHGSLDRKFILWRMGDGNLAIVNLTNFRISKLLPSFWIFKERNCMPVAACGSAGMNKIVASSMASANEHILHFWQRNFDRVKSFECKDKVKGMMRISCIDCDSRSSILIFGGLSTPRYNSRNRRSQSSTMIVSVKFDQDFQKLSEIVLPLKEFGKPRRVKRIPDSDIFMMGTLYHILILELKLDGKINQIGILENLHKSEITDFLIYDNKLLSKGYKENHVVLTKLEVQNQEPPESDRYYIKEMDNIEALALSGAENYQSLEQDNQIFENKKMEDSQISSYRNLNPVDIKTIRTINSNTRFEKVTLSKRGDFLYVGGEENLQIFLKDTSGEYILHNTKSKSWIFLILF